MPLFDYRCTGCAHEFEALVRGTTVPRCPQCDGDALERLLSLPVLKSDARRERIARESKARDAAVAKDRTHEQLKYERSHND
jgi:putative FmdB family regulatory protein